MNLRQLHAFTHVSQLGSFTRASVVLSVTQPVLSRWIRQLEVELQQVLLKRTGRGVELTEAGKRLLAHGQGILAQIERAKLDLQDAKSGPIGHLVLSIPSSVSPIVTVPIITDFRTRFPRATLAVTESPSTQTNEWISTGRVDLALVYSPIASTAVEMEPLVTQSLCLIGSTSDTAWMKRRGETVPTKSLPQFPLILSSRRHSVRLYIESLMASAGIRPNVVWEIDSFHPIPALVRAGFGYGIMSEPLARWYSTSKEVRIRRLVNPEIKVTLSLAWANNRTQTPLAQHTLDLIRKLVPDLLS